MKIKVLHIHTLPVISGSGINTFLSMRGLDKNRYAVELGCAPGGALIDLVRSHRMKVRLFANFVQPIDPLNDFLALVRLTTFLKRRQYHIIHTHNSKGGFIGRLAGRIAKVPIVIHTVHGFSFHDQEPLWRRFLFLNLERMAAPWSDRMIFISQPLIDWALKERICGPDRIEKIYSGIETDKFVPPSSDQREKARNRWQIGLNDRVIGIVSKLWEGKGHHTLIEALPGILGRVPDARLMIVGEGHLRQELEAAVKRRGLERAVIFTGFQAEVQEVMAAFDISVLPSFFEGMGRVLLEAMAMEIPVVASRVGGIPDLVSNGDNGYLVEAGRSAEFAGAIAAILENPELARQMGRSGRQMVAERFSADFMVRAIENVYLETLAEKGLVK